METVLKSSYAIDTYRYSSTYLFYFRYVDALLQYSRELDILIPCSNIRNPDSFNEFIYNSFDMCAVCN